MSGGSTLVSTLHRLPSLKNDLSGSQFFSISTMDQFRHPVKQFDNVEGACYNIVSALLQGVETLLEHGELVTVPKDSKENFQNVFWFALHLLSSAQDLLSSFAGQVIYDEGRDIGA
jgi:hypothetical protein